MDSFTKNITIAFVGVAGVLALALASNFSRSTTPATCRSSRPR
jgi:hypothetical protein